MSFGVGIGDAILLTQLTSRLISDIKNAGVDFQEFTDDLCAIHGVFELIQSNWADFDNHMAGDLADDRARATTQTSFNGARKGLEALQERLHKHHLNMTSRFWKTWAKKRFEKDLDSLRRRLQFHMSSLQLISNLVLLHRQQSQHVQERRIEQTIHFIREGQLEQEHIDEDSTKVDVADDIDSDFDTALGAFAVQYVPGRTEYSVKTRTLASVSSRDIIIERWRREVEMQALPEPIFSDDDTTEPIPDSSSSLLEGFAHRPAIERADAIFRWRVGLSISVLLSAFLVILVTLRLNTSYPTDGMLSAIDGKGVITNFPGQVGKEEYSDLDTTETETKSWGIYSNWTKADMPAEPRSGEWSTFYANVGIYGYSNAHQVPKTGGMIERKVWEQFSGLEDLRRFY